MIFNLVDNAVRFTPEGGEVRIEAHRHNGSVEVSVADAGVGIPPEALPRLFERFYRVDPARAREDGGTGIGLAIARSVVEAHGGTIRAESEPGQGSTFTFDLPVASSGGPHEQEGSVKSVTTTVTTSAPERYAFLDLTDDLRRAVKDSGVTEGAAIVFCAHTTRAADQRVGGRCDGRLRRHSPTSCRTKASTTSTTTSRSARRT